MKNMMIFVIAAILVIIGIGLLYLTNSRILSFRRPAIRHISEHLGPAPEVTAFVNVNVVPMDSERIIEHQTVIVREGIIERIGLKQEVIVPDGVQIVEGNGRFLTPGLADMHIHIKDENDLLLFVANGVTTVRDLWGTTGVTLLLGFPDQLTLRDEVSRGHLLGPRIVTSGPIMEGDPVTMPLMPAVRAAQDAEDSIKEQVARGYDYVKVYDNLQPDVYQAILDTAGREGLHVVGHVPRKVGLNAVLDGGQQTIEHLTGYIDPDTADFIIPRGELAVYAQKTAAAGVWNCPTIGVYQKNVPTDEIDQLLLQPGMPAVSPKMKAIWRMMLPQMVAGHQYDGADYPARIAEIYIEMTRALHEAGAGIILGTDTTNPYLVPGYSLLDELDYLILAGFSPYEALLAGTRNAADALGEDDVWGKVAEGMRADLILVEENPLNDVRHMRERAGVMVNGRWLSQAAINSMLDSLIASYRPTLIGRVLPLVFLIAAGAILWLSWR